MTDRPIIFSAPMVQALLDGRKTQTRRILKCDNCGAPIMPWVEGDRLWVREAWRTSPVYDDLKPSDMNGDESIRYEADARWQSWGWGSIGCIEGGRLRSPIHMPRWASRLTLIVTDVRVQRLHEISEADAVAEGINVDGDGRAWGVFARDLFEDLWNSLHGPDAWDQNPWVAAVSFKVVKGGGDD